MSRISVVDGLRGACLVLMTLTHMEFGRPLVASYVHLKQLSFADSAQGFVFLAGLVLGGVGMRRIMRGQAAQQSRWCRHRAAQLYGVHIGMLAALLILSQVIPGASDAWTDWLGPLAEPDGGHDLPAFFMLLQPTFLDILPQYVLYLLLTPLALAQIQAGRSGLVLGVSIAIWLSTQLGLHLPLIALVELQAAAFGHPLALRGYFNPAAWQLVFVAGLLLGAHAARGTLANALALRPEQTQLLQAAVVIIAFAASWRLSLATGLLPDELIERLIPLERRSELGMLTVMSFAAIAYVVAWLLIAGREARSWAVRRISGGLNHLFGSAFLTLLGRHALPVFVWHVLAVYLAAIIDYADGGLADPTRSILALGIVLSLAIPALLAEHGVRPTAALRPTPMR